MKYLYFVNAILISSSIHAYSNPFEQEHNYTQPVTYTAVVIPSQPQAPSASTPTRNQPPAVEILDSLIKVRWPQFLSSYDLTKRLDLMTEFVIRASHISRDFFELSVEWARSPSEENYVSLIKTAIEMLSSEKRNLLLGLSMHFIEINQLAKTNQLAGYDFVVLTVSDWLLADPRS